MSAEPPTIDQARLADIFSSFILQAQASKAKVVGLANTGGDMQNAIKQASEFGLQKGGQKIAALLFDVTDANSLGLQAAQGAENKGSLARAF
jgi:branched-chain amino acid transport system substrate-binding protein